MPATREENARLLPCGVGAKAARTRRRVGARAERIRPLDRPCSRCPLSAARAARAHARRAERVGGDRPPAQRQDAQLPAPARRGRGGAGGRERGGAARRVLLEPRLQRRPRDAVKHQLRDLLATFRRAEISGRISIGRRPILRRPRPRQRRAPEHRLGLWPVQRLGRRPRALRLPLRRRLPGHRRIPHQRVQTGDDLPHRRTARARARKIHQSQQTADGPSGRVLPAHAADRRRLLRSEWPRMLGGLEKTQVLRLPLRLQRLHRRDRVRERPLRDRKCGLRRRQPPQRQSV